MDISGLGGGVSSDTPRCASFPLSALVWSSESFIKCERGGKAGGGELDMKGAGESNEKKVQRKLVKTTQMIICNEL